LSINRFSPSLGERKGEGEENSKRDFFFNSGVKLCALHVKDQAFPSEAWEKSVNTIVGKQ
jgi:hypothetical protein